MLRRPRQVAGGSALGQRRALQSLASHEVRARFLRFFEARGHRVVPSASLVPPGGDGSLLFTNAGMVPFKQVFTGQERREYARATTAQRCVRAGGKHNDLDQVGLTRRHHTLFEMLGNFSFGDYFKEQAVAYSWEFLTRDLALPVDRLHVTVLDSDREARELWRKIAGLPDHKIVSYDEKENFWAIGDSGPCGPCSEIFWDLGDHIADPDERFLELWNLVFMQFQRNEGDPPDALHPLPNRSVDTGMGLERVASVLQNVPSNYHTDAFVPLMRTVAHVLDRKSAGSAFQAALEHELDPTAMRFGNNAHIQALRIIADHLRATYAMLRDGIFPSNIGRGYVLRRIIRRAIRHAQQLGVSDGLFLSEIVMPEWEQQQGFPQLRAIVANEERAFEEMLRNGRHAMEKVFASAQAGDRRMIAGFDAFRLYDTFGIPLDITQVLAEERGISVDAAGFDAALQEHRQKASESSAFHNNVSDVGDAAVREGLLAAGDLGKTEFVGYETLQVSDARVLSIRRGASPAGKKGKTNDEGKSFVVSIDPCPFYAEGGGQVGDRGALTFTTSSGETLRAAVVDTQKRGGDGGDMIELHCVIDSSVSSDAADHLEHEFSTHSVSAEVDGEFRSGCQAHHTATHMLQRALKQVLGDHVTQCGSFVGTDRLRFDFAHFGALSSAEIDQVEELVNRMALTRSPVDTTVLPRDQAEQSGAICNFGEKYGDMVRVVRVGVSGEEDLVSSEFCGGTHATNSLEVFPFVILSEGSVAAGTRRMEAVAGVHGAKHLQTKDQALEDLAVQLETTAAKVPERVAKIQKQVKGLESQLQALGDVVATAFPPTPIAVAEVVDAAVSVSVELHELPALKGAEMSKVLRRRAEFLLSLQPDRVILVRMGNQLVCASNGAGASHAGKLLQRVVKGAGGRGGGNATFAQGSLGADSVDGDELLGSLLS